MPYEFYTNYINNLAQTPTEEWETSYQQSLLDFWDNTSTATVVDGQTQSGGLIFNSESVQLNSVINPTTGESFGDQYRKLVHQIYTDDSDWLGKYYSFGNAKWLTTNTNTRIGSVKTSILRKCNNTLRWLDANGILNQWDCVYSRQFNGTSLDYGTQGVPQIGADSFILVQQNEYTSTIPFNQRFLFDGHAFQVKQIDNHYSDTLMTIYIFETQIQSNDDLVNNIAGGSEVVTPTTHQNKILPAVNKILLNTAQSFTVYNYINGVQSSDEFTITATGPLAICYDLDIIDGNNFTVHNNIVAITPLVISCENNTSGEVVTATIRLGGAW